MKKTLHILLTICIALTLSLLSCSKKAATEKTDDPWDDLDQFKLKMSLEEKQEDYEYFWDFIYNGWPFLEVCERRGIALAQIKKEGEEQLKDITYRSDYSAFYDDLGFKIAGEGYIGHFWPHDYSDYIILKDYYEYPVFNLDGTENEKIINFYNAIADDPFDYYGLLRANSQYHSFSSDERPVPQTKIIKAGEIAYIKIDTFNLSAPLELHNEYYNTIEKFLNLTKNYKHLIIDISKNRGGHIEYWMGLVGLTLEYNTELAFKRYGLYNDNKYTEIYMEKFLTNFKVTEFPIKKVPNVKNANTKKNTKAFMHKLYIPNIHGYLGLDTHPRKDRKNWLLISKDTFSAADRFANFCKACDWATVIGTNTSGGGADVSLWAPIVLPNSGLMIRSDIVYGLNNEGYCNNEYGTIPDIYTEKGKTALETCLDAIEKYDKEHGE